MSSRIHFSTELQGIEPVVHRIEELTRLGETKTVRRAFRKAGWVLLREAQANLKASYRLPARKRTGNLYRSASVRPLKRSIGVLAGWRRTRSRGRGGGNHAHLHDRGTRARYTRSGMYRGVMPASTFYTRAKTSSSRLVLATIERALYEAGRGGPTA